MIDSKATKEGTQKVIAEIAELTKSPISRIVYTHSDPESFNGRDAYPNSAAIISSTGILDDYRKNKTVYLEMDAPAAIYAAWPRTEFLPSITFEGQLTLRIGQNEVTLLHYGDAHTSGDTVIWFKEEKIAFIGDLVFPGREPLIQDQKGGNSFGIVRILSLLLSLKPKIKTFVPSHGDPVDRATVLECRIYIEDIHNRVTAMFETGHKLEDVKKALGIKEPESKAGAWNLPSLAVTVYRELSEKKY